MPDRRELLEPRERVRRPGARGKSVVSLRLLRQTLAFSLGGALATSRAAAQEAVPAPPPPPILYEIPQTPPAFSAKEKPRVVVSAYAPASVRWLYGLPVYGGGAGITIGMVPHDPRLARWNFDFYGQYTFGATAELLLMHTFRAGVRYERVIGRFRPGVGIDSSALFINRPSAETGFVWHWGIGLQAGAAFDLTKTERGGGVYLAPRFTLEVIPHRLVPRTLSPLASLELGYRI